MSDRSAGATHEGTSASVEGDEVVAIMPNVKPIPATFVNYVLVV